MSEFGVQRIGEVGTAEQQRKLLNTVEIPFLAASNHFSDLLKSGKLAPSVQDVATSSVAQPDTVDSTTAIDSSKPWYLANLGNNTSEISPAGLSATDYQAQRVSQQAQELNMYNYMFGSAA
jgi:hypothetical protein